MDLSIFKGTTIVMLDIESTSTSVKTTFVRELGVAEYVDGLLVRANSALYSGGICEAGALAVHGLSDEMVEGKPTFSSKFKFASGYLSNKIIGGHNVNSFDLPIIQRIVYSGGGKIVGDGPLGKIRTIDTLLLARKHLRLPSNKLSELCAVFEIEHGGHRAHGDAVSSWNLLLKIIETCKFKSLNDIITLV